MSVGTEVLSEESVPQAASSESDQLSSSSSESTASQTPSESVSVGTEVLSEESVPQAASSESDQLSSSSSESTASQTPSESVSVGTEVLSEESVPQAASSESDQPSPSVSPLEVICWENTQVPVAQSSPEVPPLPLTKLTAKLNVTFPDPFAGAFHVTVHDLEFELECVTSPLCNFALGPGFDQEP